MRSSRACSRERARETREDSFWLWLFLYECCTSRSDCFRSPRPFNRVSFQTCIFTHWSRGPSFLLERQLVGRFSCAWLITPISWLLYLLNLSIKQSVHLSFEMRNQLRIPLSEDSRLIQQGTPKSGDLFYCRRDHYKKKWISISRAMRAFYSFVTRLKNDAFQLFTFVDYLFWCLFFFL